MNIGCAFLIVLCNMLSWQASRLVTSLFAIELGASQIQIGTMIAAYALFPMLLAFYAGKLTDRLGVRAPMIFGSAGVATGIAIPFVFPLLPALYASATIIGASHVFYNVAMQNLIGILSSNDTRTRNYTNLTLFISTSSMLGPLAAGFSIDHYGHVYSYLYFAGLPLISVLTLLLFARGLKRPAAKADKTRAHAGDADSLFAIAPLRRILIAGGIISTGHDLFQFYMPIYGHAVGLSASSIGMVMSCFGAAAFAVRVVMPAMSRRWGEQNLLLWSVFLAAAAYLLFPMFESAAMLAAVAFMLGLSIGCCAPLSLTLIHMHAPQRRSGEALGMRLTINNFTHMAVPLLFGALGTFMGVAPVFMANAVMLASGGMLILRPDKS